MGVVNKSVEDDKNLTLKNEKGVGGGGGGGGGRSII